jgi:hypothetical protein
MKRSRSSLRRIGSFSSLGMALCLAGFVAAQSAFAADSSGDKVPLVIKLPAPAFKGTPKDIQLST